MGLPHVLVVAAVSWVIHWCLSTAREGHASIEGDTLRFRRAAGLRALGLFPLAAAMAISAFLFGLGRLGPIPWLLALAAAWWLVLRLSTPGDLVVTPREIRALSRIGFSGKVIPWAEASHAVIVPQKYMLRHQVVEYDDIVVIHNNGDIRIKHTEGHEDPKGFVEAVQQHTSIYRSESDPMAFAEPLDLDLESRAG